jgi:sugar lactone lactonase YvrE
MHDAPELPADLTWLNTDRPLRLRTELAGHVVVVLLWTASSIHCVHAQQAMLYLSARFAGRAFAAIGVHHARFPGERSPDAVRACVQELGVCYAVLVDERGAVGREFGCQAWPTIVLIDARGAIRFRGAGEPDRDKLAAAVEALLREGAEQGALASPSQAPIAEPDRGGGALRFPSGLALDPARDWLWIADTGHHRVVAIDARSGELRAIVGSGTPGFVDGGSEAAAFFAPRGLAVVDGELFVADTGNHALRRVDASTQRVATLAGDGRPSRDLAGGRAGRDQGLRLPCALAACEDALFVAMAGAHQIWQVDPRTGQARARAGNGRAHLGDGIGAAAGLAQPAGLAASGGELFVLDAEASAVRAFDPASGALRTLLGSAGGEFGDVDGPLAQARLQHPIGIAADGDDLLIADALNAKVKRLRRARGTIETLLGAGLQRPVALAVHGDHVFVADSFAHAVLRVELASGAARSLAIAGLTAPTAGWAARAAPLAVRAMSDVTLRIPVSLLPGEHLHPDVPMRLRCTNVQGYPLLVDVDTSPELEHDQAVLYGVPFAEPGEGVFRVRLSWLTCIDRDAACHPNELVRDVAVVLDARADADVVLLA